MPIAKLKDSSSSDAMKLEEGNDSLDTFIRQAIGKEPALSFSRTNDSQVQWIQLLHALDQQDLPGWPMLTSLKVQMQKCDKCSWEFCSPINYRRHIRVHRRSFYVDKESHKNRDLLGAFWDKFSLDEAKEIVSFKDVMLEGVPGSSIIEALESFIHKPGFVIPQAYVKAGSVLLDVIQARPSRLPISSQELFSVLDDASERTFLCAGSTESMQKYVFDGEAGKIGLEMKNLVACTSFLIEQKLLKAWLADKDAEALRCQKLLVEEEEAAQRRQAELLERKRQKKLRQEQKAKEQLYKENPESKSIADILKSPPSAEPSSPQPVESSAEHVPSHLEPLQAADIEVQVGFNSEQLGSGSARNVEPRNDLGHGRRHLVITRRQVPKSQWGGRNGFHHGQNLRILKPELVQKNGPNRDIRAAPVIGSKVWTRKTKIENGRGRVPSRGQEEEITEPTSCELMIGSIPVPVRNFAAQQQVNSPSEVHVVPKKSNAQDKLMKPDSIPSSTNRSTIKIWRPISSHGTQGEVAVQSGNQESKDDSVSGVGCELEGDDSKSMEIMQPKGLPFSSQAARAFLAQRWKEAISGDHLTLVLSPEPESQGSHGSAENPVGNVGPLESSNRGHAKAKLRRMPGKGVKKEYIPKQRSVN